MSYAVLSETALAGVVRAGDSRRFNVDLKLHRQLIISGASTNALAATICLKDFTTTKLKGRTYISYREYEKVLLVRAVAKHLKRRLAIKMPDRNNAVKGIISALTDSTPFHVVRCDISSFYESIEVEPLKELLLYDTSSSQIVRDYLKKFFDVHCTEKFGLPRGAGISAVLSEIALRNFDKGVVALAGVYRYYRYADDIVLFTTGCPEQLLADVSKLLPRGMRLNRNKDKSYFRSFNLTKSGTKGVVVEDTVFDFLGYQFATTPVSGASASRKVDVSISDKKIRKIKTKIFMSLLHYRNDMDNRALLDRLFFISSNYIVKRLGVTHYKSKKFAYSGVYYNYINCGTYKINKRSEIVKGEYNCNQLKQVDGYLHNLLFGRKSEFSAYIRYGFRGLDRRKLNNISLNMGYKKKMIIRFSPERISFLKRAWRNE